MHETLEMISRHCPEAMTTYFHCRNRLNDFGTVKFTKKQIEEELSEDYRKFRNDIKKLARENLLEWATLDGGIFVTLAACDE